MRGGFYKVAMLVPVLSSIGVPQVARASTWADGLFSERAYDFGAIPRGAKVRHSFVLNNRLAEPLTILDVRASCGCTTGWANAKLVPAGQATTIDAEMDTRNFVGKKSTVLTVSLVTAGGRQSEVQLGVSSMILSDIVLNPGTVDFGTVARGQGSSQEVTIERIGAPGWRVERMVSGCQAIDAVLTEAVRSAENVGYLLKVTLKPDAPAGVLRDEIRLLTNDRESRVLPIQVTALLRGEVTASPSLLSLGTVNSAGTVQGRFLLRASKPFSIRSIAGTTDGFHASADDQSAKPVHIVSVTFQPDEATARGDVRHAFRIETDLEGEPALEVFAVIHVEP
jgi:hypothetical protein